MLRQFLTSKLKLFELLSREPALRRRDLYLAAAVAGLASAGILTLINRASGEGPLADDGLRQLILFLLALVLYSLSLEHTLKTMAVLFQSLITSLRTRIVEKIWAADLARLEKISHEEIINRMTGEAELLSESQQPLAAALYSLILVIVTALYLASLSLVAFLGFILLGSAGTMLYLKKELEVERSLLLGDRLELDFAERLIDLLKGFKEAKIHRPRGQALLEDIQATSQALYRSNLETARLFSSNYVFSHGAFYILIGLLVFIPPQWNLLQADLLPELVAAILFIIGPLLNVVEGIPALTKANIAAQNLLNLEAQLVDLEDRLDIEAPTHRELQFERSIELRGITFSHLAPQGRPLFTIGPLNLTIRKGETLFIVGGNGDGKSTLLKVLAGLYSPHRGQLIVDGRPLRDRNSAAFRQLVSAIFADFHLFRRLYGLPDADETYIEKLLAALELSQKTNYADGSFSTLELSTGQRKRLALLVTLLEDRPLYIFDEWAADQAPQFREFFYRDFLRQLKRRNKTVIVVTHDHEFLDSADQVVHFLDGNIRKIEARMPKSEIHPRADLPRLKSSAIAQRAANSAASPIPV